MGERKSRIKRKLSVMDTRLGKEREGGIGTIKGVREGKRKRKGNY